jgi:hypothetical protein
MWSIATSQTFPLSSVKPLDGLLKYRAYCLDATRRAVAGARRRRERSPGSEAPLQSVGDVEGLEYLRCAETGSLFLGELPPAADWRRLLGEVSRYRRSPDAFHTGIARSRNDTVYAPKLEWIESTLRVQGFRRPSVMEVASPPSDFRSLLERSGAFGELVTVDEMELAASTAEPEVVSERRDGVSPVETAVLLESVDRVDDPHRLLCAVARRLADGGLLFVTALVASGFDIAVLGFRNLYLYPPDRANCFTLRGLELLIRRAGFTPLEVSTPGVLDVEIVQAHLLHDPTIPLSGFERLLLGSVTEKVLRTAPCPVMVIPPRAPDAAGPSPCSTQPAPGGSP